MRKKHRRKRKSRKVYDAKATRPFIGITDFLTRIPNVVPGGNPFGLGEWTLMVARGPARAA